MTMPRDLVLVRHGESEGNVAHKRSRAGDNSLNTSEFLARHGSSWRLTDKGREQAVIAGEWVKENVNGGVFGRLYVSPYLRARETAGLLDLPASAWREVIHLREREWGDLENMTEDDRRRKFAESIKRREVVPLYWRPQNGESIADVCETRVYRFFDTLHRECSEMGVIAVLHGELMWAMRVVLEHMSPERYAELDLSDDPRDHIHNCQILHYTRTDPYTGKLTKSYQWMRSICPTDLSKSRTEWEQIVRPICSNEDLLAVANRTPRLISG